ncbi:MULTISPECIES: hypothetical protein [unclassified Pseudomonas]|uniref:hypothetical protein n=1 Tax=unclassified Pseudomonas TaxID=196821 RepID=UPI002AC8B881|nr:MULTISPECIES: hypothetical protein [unclassified Pseudomonas]MEB0048255.1 hypothetical protein [Pseudomonas sp. Dout3]MEB0099214.1 hypothetical protein [Pseudomonas sp. DC1.2]WPX61509.1 hypothetical protein RHM68_13020 [Pseudomonas sp. DC1.2]
MKRHLTFLAFTVLLLPPRLYADTDFIIPEQCTQGATGAASSDLATAGDPPIVEVYRSNTSTPDKYATVTNIYTDGSKNWYVEFDAPQYDSYAIKASYTPFLTTYQSAYYYQGPSGKVALAVPVGTAKSRIGEYYNIKLGNALGGAFIEFVPDIVADDPFTMQVNDSGDITVYCYQEVSGGQAVTVYDKDHEFYGTGKIQSDGTIRWDQSEQ